MPLHKQVLTLCAANQRLLLDVPVKDMKKFQREMLTWLDEKYPNLGEEIERIQALDESLIERITAAVKEYKSQVVK